jgi:hypothetical protein
VRSAAALGGEAREESFAPDPVRAGLRAPRPRRERSRGRHAGGSRAAVAGGVDTLTLTLASASSSSGLSSISVSLFDGQTLLGQVTTNASARIFGFPDAGSVWTLNRAIPNVDLTSVRGGAIDGHLLVTPVFTGGAQNPFFDVLLPAFPPIQSGHATQAAGILAASPDPVLGTPQVVPEPGAAALLGLGLLALARVGRPPLL